MDRKQIERQVCASNWWLSGELFRIASGYPDKHGINQGIGWYENDWSDGKSGPCHPYTRSDLQSFMHDLCNIQESASVKNLISGRAVLSSEQRVYDRLLAACKAHGALPIYDYYFTHNLTEYEMGAARPFFSLDVLEILVAGIVLLVQRRLDPIRVSELYMREKARAYCEVYGHRNAGIVQEVIRERVLS